MSSYGDPFRNHSGRRGPAPSSSNRRGVNEVRTIRNVGTDEPRRRPQGSGPRMSDFWGGSSPDAEPVEYGRPGRARDPLPRVPSFGDLDGPDYDGHRRRAGAPSRPQFGGFEDWNSLDYDNPRGRARDSSPQFDSYPSDVRELSDEDLERMLLEQRSAERDPSPYSGRSYPSDVRDLSDEDLERMLLEQRSAERDHNPYSGRSYPSDVRDLSDDLERMLLEQRSHERDHNPYSGRSYPPERSRYPPAAHDRHQIPTEENGDFIHPDENRASNLRDAHGRAARDFHANRGPRTVEAAREALNNGGVVIIPSHIKRQLEADGDLEFERVRVPRRGRRG